jgi:hypothetical protein
MKIVLFGVYTTNFSTPFILGFWFFHCHIEFHMNIGMGLLIQVGNPNDMPKVPKNFPKCGNWKFSGYEVEEEEKYCVSAASSYMSLAFSVLIILSVSVVKILQVFLY